MRGSVAHVELFFEDTYGYTSDVFLEDVSDREQVHDPSCESDEGERYDFYPCTGEYTGTAYRTRRTTPTRSRSTTSVS